MISSKGIIIGCKALTALLGPENVFVPGSSGYNASVSSYFSPQAAHIQPECFVTPKTVQEVAAVVKSLQSSSSSSSSSHRPGGAAAAAYAIRGGGHTWFAGANSAAGGITIDLRGLDGVELGADRSSVTVGAGATWDAVYGALDPLGLSVAGGRVAGVGVGGLALGGGISYFSPRRGWTCDQVARFEVVLADGEVVLADREHNADLWWGLRGGSGNFGIVTSMTFPTFEQGSLWSTLYLTPTAEVDSQARIYAEIMAAENYDVDASFLTGWAFIGQQGATVALNQLVHTRPVGDEVPAVYKPVLALPPAVPEMVTPPVIGPMSTLAQNSAQLQPPQKARYMTAITGIIPTEAMIRAAYDAFETSIPAVRGVAGVMWACNIEPIPPTMYDNSEAGGARQNALGLAGRSGSLALFLISPSWADAADDEKVYAAARALIADVDRRAKGLGAHDPFVYLDYAAPWQAPIESYGAESVKKLQEIRKRVDPHQFFTRQVKGGFKIPQ